MFLSRLSVCIQVLLMRATHAPCAAHFTVKHAFGGALSFALWLAAAWLKGACLGALRRSHVPSGVYSKGEEGERRFWHGARNESHLSTQRRVRTNCERLFGSHQSAYLFPLLL